MAAVDFLHHENPRTWAGIKPASLGTEGQRQTNYTTQPADKIYVKGEFSFNDLKGMNQKLEEIDNSLRLWNETCVRRDEKKEIIIKTRL
ncbi:hypothetical protein TNCV_4176211 [Trichonephila clavipes]|nr:hypothetical protein TNCV_4176211 [Trichonephila clavipes]